MIRRLIIGMLALATAVALAGCGDQDGGEATDDPATTTTTAAPSHTYANGPEDVVLDVFTGGGYTPLEYQFALRPVVRVMGDGRVFLSAADDDGWNTNLRGVREYAATPAQIQQILALADAAGLLGPAPDYEMAGGVMVTDMPTTTVTVNADDDTYSHAAYALGFGEGQTPAREALSTFIGDVVDLVADGEATPYEPTSLQIYVSSAEFFDAGDDSQMQPWPGPDLAGVQGCEEIAAEPEVVRALTDNPSSTLFTQGAEVYRVTGAMLLPGEQACVGWE